MRPLDERFGACAVRLGYLVPAQIESGLRWLRAHRDGRSLASLCLAHGVLTPTQVDEIHRGMDADEAPTIHTPAPSAPSHQEGGLATGFLAELPTGALAEPRVVFDVIEGPARGRRFNHPARNSFVIGRLQEVLVPLVEDATVSRRHCLVQVCPPRARLSDLSKNGTLVNGKRVTEEVELRAGDRIQVGRSVLRFTSERFGGQEAAPPPAPGRLVLPGLEIVRELGRGGAGVVYLASRPDGQLVAVKTIQPGNPTSSVEVSRFLNEANYGARVDHPNAVKVLGSGFHEGLFYFVLEYVDGPDMRQELERRGRPFSPRKAIRLMRELFPAVAAAHRRGLVHRDIKPANIMLARVGDGFIPKLTDFGLMRSFEGAGLTFTATGEGKGTPEFMPPEQLEHARSVGPTADIYSLGATLYFALTGKPPIDLKAGDHPLLVVAEGARIPLHERLPQVRDALESVVMRCLEMSPADRFQTVPELEAALAAAAI